MPSAFEVLANDHERVKRMLTEFESGPTAVTGAKDSQLALRKKMAEQLVIEESKHEAVEEMYFWPAVRDRLPDGDRLADSAVGQEQEGKKVLDKLDKLEADDPAFEELLSEFIKAGRHELSLLGGYYVSDLFDGTFVLQGAYTYHLTEDVGVEGSFGWGGVMLMALVGIGLTL